MGAFSVEPLSDLLPRLPKNVRPQSAMSNSYIAPYDQDLLPSPPSTTKLQRRPSSRSGSRALTPTSTSSSARTPEGDVKSSAQFDVADRTQSGRPTITPRHALFQRHIKKSQSNINSLMAKVDIHLGSGFLLRNMFCLFDRYKRNRVSYEDFREAINKLRVPGGEPEALALFDEYDRKNKGFLEFEDFQAVQMQNCKGTGRSPFLWRRDRLAKHRILLLTPIGNSEHLAQIFRDKVHQRVRGRRNIIKAFTSGDHVSHIDYNQFQNGCARFGLNVSETDSKQLFSFFDRNQTGFVKTDNLVDMISEDPWTAANQKKLPPYLCTFDDAERRRYKTVKEADSGRQYREALVTLKSVASEGDDHLQFITNEFEKHKGTLTYPQFHKALREKKTSIPINTQDTRIVFEKIARANEEISLPEFLKIISSNTS